MQKRLEKYCRENRLLEGGDNLLVCCSGGVDSMVLLHLLLKWGGGGRIEVAHCNFGLRNEQSDADTALVENFCRQREIRCHIARFNTKQIAQEQGKSIQIVARELRYNFFAQVAQQRGLTKVAIAHHGDDSTETFFINLLRGSGLRGLTGIVATRNAEGEERIKIIRPLLFASRGDIEKYAVENSVEYRTDMSNFKTEEYLRSRLRYDIIPRLEGSNNSFRSTMAQNLEYLSQAQRFIDHTVGQLRSKFVRGNIIDIGQVRQHPEASFLLFELLRPYNFSGSIISDILLACHSGKQFSSSTHCATIDRNTLIINPLDNNAPPPPVVIEKGSSMVEWLEVKGLFLEDGRVSSEVLESSSSSVILCGDSLSFPLILRVWESGDWFIPFGMRSQKKVSDYLIDIKMPLPLKSRQLVLLNGSTIIWLVGQRLDDRYRLTLDSRTAVRITLP